MLVQLNLFHHHFQLNTLHVQLDLTWHVENDETVFLRPIDFVDDQVHVGVDEHEWLDDGSIGSFGFILHDVIRVDDVANVKWVLFRQELVWGVEVEQLAVAFHRFIYVMQVFR